MRSDRGGGNRGGRGHFDGNFNRGGGMQRGEETFINFILMHLA